MKYIKIVYIYEIYMLHQIMRPPSYQCNGFVTSDALGHMM